MATTRAASIFLIMLVLQLLDQFFDFAPFHNRGQAALLNQAA